MNKLLKKSRRLATTAMIASSAFVSSFALAVDDAEVTAAFTAGEASTLNATTGLIGLIAVVVGVSIVISLLRKA